MKIRIALVGELLSDRRLFGSIDILLGQISGYLCKGNAKADIELLVSPSYTGAAWAEWNQLHGFEACTYNLGESPDYVEHCTRVVRKETALRNLLGEAMCDRADVMLVVWNEDVTELSGATWEFMQIAYKRKAPCIWISTKTHQTFCLWEAYYKQYSPQYLEATCEPLQEGGLEPFNSEGGAGRMVGFWEKRRRKYLKKHNADISIHPSEEDYILNRDFKLEQEVSGGEDIRIKLLEKYEQFDAAAIKWNSRFQAMIYQGSVLPFVTTIFLAIGSYSEALIGGTVPTAVTLARVLAGIAFFIYGSLSLYVYRLSKSRHIGNWQKDFVNNRYVTEILRILIHFMPYGVETDLRRLCAGNRKLYMRVVHLTDGAEPKEQKLDRRVVSYALQHIKEMLEDQISYHEFSKGRYKAVVESLEKWGKIIFYLSFWMVLGCGILQFILIALLIWLRGQEGAVELARTFFNLLALVLPAWAGYFFTKSQQNNFRYNYDNHQGMINRLSAIREKVAYLSEQEEIPMEVFDIVVDELAEAMVVEDTAQWRAQYMSSAIKTL